MDYWKTKQFGEVYEPSNRLTPDDCWQAYEAMDAGDKSTMTYYANKLVNLRVKFLIPFQVFSTQSGLCLLVARCGQSQHLKRWGCCYGMSRLARLTE